MTRLIEICIAVFCTIKVSLMAEQSLSKRTIPLLRVGIVRSVLIWALIVAGLRLVFDGYELSLNKDQNMLPKTACAMVGRVHSIAYIKYPTPSE